MFNVSMCSGRGKCKARLKYLRIRVFATRTDPGLYMNTNRYDHAP